MLEVLTLTPICSPENGCELLPVRGGRYFGQYELRDDGEPTGWVESCLVEMFLHWKRQGARPREDVGVYPTTMLDASADQWLWMPPGTPDKSYSSRPAFTKWWRGVIEQRTLTPVARERKPEPAVEHVVPRSVQATMFGGLIDHG